MSLRSLLAINAPAKIRGIIGRRIQEGLSYRAGRGLVEVTARAYQLAGATTAQDKAHVDRMIQETIRGMDTATRLEGGRGGTNLRTIPVQQGLECPPGTQIRYWVVVTEQERGGDRHREPVEVFSDRPLTLEEAQSRAEAIYLQGLSRTDTNPRTGEANPSRITSRVVLVNQCGVLGE